MVKSPSFADLKPASEASSLAKRHNRRTDTQHEMLLRRELWRMGLRYRKNVDTLPGKPDIVFVRARVAVFCDGDFWHGRNWEEQKPKLCRGTNAEYWLSKIESNMERDRLNDALLEADGWSVFRFWETDIKRDPQATASLIREVVIERHKALEPAR
jgi:DNA mismatch endonuclease (patch repair protein)